MPTPPLDHSVYVATARLIAQHDGNVSLAAEASGMNRNKFARRARNARALGLWGRDGWGGFWTAVEAGGTGRPALGPGRATHLADRDTELAIRGAHLVPHMEAVEVTDRYDADGELEGFSVRQRAEAQDALGTPDQPLPNFAYKRISTLYGRENEKLLEWQIQSPERAKLVEGIRAFISELAQPIKGLSPLIPAPPVADANLLSVYPIGDQHHGMRTDATTGGVYDCATSGRLLTSAVDRLCSTAPASHTALLLDLGDFHHANDSKNETPGHGHQLTVDGSYGHVMHTGGMALVRCVLRLLERHQRVIVWIMPGNHNPDAAFATALALAFYFHNEPRVEVDLGTTAFKFFRFGKNLIAAHHGDGTKPANLPLLMAADRPQDWAETEYRVWHCGHVHHKTLTEHPGCDVETHRTLAPGNSWDHKKGYRSKREMQRIDYDAETGETMRTRCDVRMLEAA